MSGIQQALGESDYEQILKAGERLEARSMQRGLEQGLQRQRGMLQRQLQLRFGELPAWALDRVNAADADALDTMAEQLLVASTLVEALGEGGEHGGAKASRMPSRRRKKSR